jgi:release factor glutamine methyltransferase
MPPDDDSTAGPWTIQRLIGWTTRFLAQHNVDEPRLATEILLAHALGRKRIELYTRFDDVPPEEKLAIFRTAIRKAADHVPIAYLVGVKEFYSLEFRVTPDVLIPRPETELLVERAIDDLRRRDRLDGSVWDLGTGSGCIAVAIAKTLSQVRVVATDVSDAALALAVENAQRHGVAERIQFVVADRLDLPVAVRPPAGFDLIVSNPPYVSVEEMTTLDRTVRHHEPRLALCDEADGLDFYRSLAAGGAAYLAAGGAVLVEIPDQGAGRVAAVFSESGRFHHEGTWRDTTGSHERVMLFRFLK